MALDGLLIIYKLLDEFDPSWTLLSLVHPKLIDLIMRAMPHRILNLDSIILPSILLCLLINMSLRKNNLTSKGFLISILLCPFMANTAGKNLGSTELLNLLFPQLIAFGLAFSYIYIYLISNTFNKSKSN